MAGDRRIEDMNTKPTVPEKRKKSITEIDFKAQQEEDSNKKALLRSYLEEEAMKKWVPGGWGPDGWGPRVDPINYREDENDDTGATWGISQRQKRELKERKKELRKSTLDSRRTRSSRRTSYTETSLQTTSDVQKEQTERKPLESERKHVLYSVQEEETRVPEGRRQESIMDWVKDAASQQITDVYTAGSSFSQELVSSPPRLETSNRDDSSLTLKEKMSGFKMSIGSYQKYYSDASAPQHVFFKQFKEHLSKIQDGTGAQGYQGALVWLEEQNVAYKNKTLDVYNNNFSAHFQNQLNGAFGRLRDLGIDGISTFEER